MELVPLQLTHVDALWAVAQHESLWRYMPFAARTYDDFQLYLRHSLAQAEKGDSMPFVTRLKDDGRVVGATSFLAINA